MASLLKNETYHELNDLHLKKANSDWLINQEARYAVFQIYLKPNVSSRPFAAQLLDHNDLLGPNCKSKHYREDCLTAHPVPPHLDAIDIAAWTFFWALSLTMIQRNVIYRFINTCIPHQALLHRLFPQIHLSPMCVQNIITEFLWPTVSIQDIKHFLLFLDFYTIRYSQKPRAPSHVVVFITLANIWKAHYRWVFNQQTVLPSSTLSSIRLGIQKMIDEDQVYSQLYSKDDYNSSIPDSNCYHKQVCVKLFESDNSNKLTFVLAHQPIVLHQKNLPSGVSVNPQLTLPPAALQRISLNLRNETLTKHRASSTHTLLTHCRPTICIDPILWLPMTQGERSRCLRWRLGWLPSGHSTFCPLHPDRSLTKSHAIKCLQMHRRLMTPETITDPLSFLLNLLPTRRPKSPSKAIPWNIRWPAICTILFELDYLQHSKIPPSPPINLGQRLLNWFPSPPST
ncbi:hypothetical protein HMPREF1544_05153 [Mucor circinelloides 1006PhL]|uniref:Uncharacterized protein n=1 Tax=Mucor circinelloides f. circinelloides (strain 1006PhL) TaxID=1220926 RepID=S2JCT2_MUCC1|nr:hypothetical protein HMPREF1544_05153 [Mucor circinelloides 1006PhL]